MIVALLLCLAATVLTGLMVEADTENEGPFAAWLGHPATRPTAVPDVGSEEQSANTGTGEEKGRESAYSEPHEFFANLSLGLVVLHLFGVLAGSVVHRENLPRAMITGRKAAAFPAPGGQNRPSST